MPRKNLKKSLYGILSAGLLAGTSVYAEDLTKQLDEPIKFDPTLPAIEPIESVESIVERKRKEIGKEVPTYLNEKNERPVIEKTREALENKESPVIQVYRDGKLVDVVKNQDVIEQEVAQLSGNRVSSVMKDTREYLNSSNVDLNLVMKEYGKDFGKGVISPFRAYTKDEDGDVVLFPFFTRPFQPGNALSPLNPLAWSKSPGKTTATTLYYAAAFYLATRDNESSGAYQTMTTEPVYSRPITSSNGGDDPNPPTPNVENEVVERRSGRGGN
jgi:hypothetical protein